jgi:hypothetical protein
MWGGRKRSVVSQLEVSRPTEPFHLATTRLRCGMKLKGYDCAAGGDRRTGMSLSSTEARRSYSAGCGIASVKR